MVARAADGGGFTLPKRERTIALVATLALCLFLITLFLQHQRHVQLEASTGELVSVWEAAGPIPSYVVITKEMVRVVHVPRRYVYPGLITKEEDLLNHVSIVDVPAGTLVTTTHIIQPDTTEPSMVRVTLTNGVVIESGLLPGDVVMVVASYRQGDADVSRIFLDEARIAAINTKDREPAVTLLVPLSRLEELVQIHDYGKAIHVTRRPVTGG